MEREAKEGDFQYQQQSRTPEQLGTTQRQEGSGAKTNDVYTHSSGDIYRADGAAALPARKRTPVEIPPEEYELLHASYEFLSAKNERRREQQREAEKRYQKRHPEKRRNYQRDYMREYMREYRAKQKQKQQSPPEVSS